MKDAVILQKQQTFTALYSEFCTEFYRYAYYFMGNAEDAEDAVADAVVNAFRYFDGLREHDKFKFWFLKILKNSCKNRHLSRSAAGTVSLDDSEEFLSVPADTPDLDVSVTLQRELEALKPDDKSIVIFSVLYGYSSEEIGELLGMTPVNVRVRLHRALNTLRRKLS
ncbi:MAG: RNA polymerase sigma factor [Clostridia bacterium]|nr:RNA polymerase sigma factor [Clostridia bacterium]